MQRLVMLQLLVLLMLLSGTGPALACEPPPAREPHQEKPPFPHRTLPGEDDSICGSFCPDRPCTYPPSEGVVHVDTALRTNGQICVRVGNGTMAPLHYGIPGKGRLTPQPAIERSRRTPQRCPGRSLPDRPTRGSQTNTDGAVQATRSPC